MKVQSVIKYLLSLVVGIGILWLLLKDFDFEKNWSRFTSANYLWILLSIVLSWVSHWLRGYRWKLLLNPLGYKLSSGNAFIAVMIGYLANLVVPRMGEVSRCAVLKKSDNIPLPTSLGTVVVERLLDLVILLILLSSILFFEFDRVYSFFSEMLLGKVSKFLNSSILVWAIVGLGIFLLSSAFLWFRYQKAFYESQLGIKIKSLVQELTQGFMSILKIENKFEFWLSTLSIWFLYYLMSYVVIFSLQETSELSLMAGLAILVAGGIGMSAPVQGGIGTYHIMVIGLLALYGISNDGAKVFAIILHTSQTISVMIVGSISLIVSFLVQKREKLTL